MPDVGFAERTKDGIADGVHQDVRVGMTGQTPRMMDFDATENQLPSFCEGMNIVPNSHVDHGRRLSGAAAWKSQIDAMSLAAESSARVRARRGAHLGFAVFGLAECKGRAILFPCAAAFNRLLVAHAQLFEEKAEHIGILGCSFTQGRAMPVSAGGAGSKKDGASRATRPLQLGGHLS